MAQGRSPQIISMIKWIGKKGTLSSQYSADVESAGRSEQAVGALDAGPGQLVNFQVFFFCNTLEFRLKRYERL